MSVLLTKIVNGQKWLVSMACIGENVSVMKDCIFNTIHREKYSNINCAEYWIPAKKFRISTVRYRICYYR